MTKNTKKRHWAMVLYPESAPADWREQLSLTGLPCAISPLHDKDLNATGEPKKAHYHIILCYGNTTTFNAVKRLTDALNSPIPQPLEQIKGYYRYLTHKDNPEKYQYDESEISTINGFNIADFEELTKSEIHHIKINLQEIVRGNDFTEYSDLLDFLLDNGMMTEHEVASNHTLFINGYIKSRRYKKERA